MKPLWITMLIGVCSLMMGACTAPRPKMPPLASIDGIPGHFAQGRIIDLAQGRSITFDELIDQLAKTDLVFVGEVHDNPEHHLMEVQILQALTARCCPLTVAMEFFTTAQQPALDRYMKGDVPEDVFLKEVDWAGGWSFPYHFYRALLLSARENRDPLIGINLPGSVVRKVARSGLDSLTTEERAHAAKEIDVDNMAHRQYLSDVFKEHSHPGLGDFEHFYQAQCLWEDTMADNIARSLTKGGKMIVFVGNGHIINRFGIPDRVLRRARVTLSTILLYPLTDRSILTKNMADYVWLTAGCSAGVHAFPPMKLRNLGENKPNETHTEKNR